MKKKSIFSDNFRQTLEFCWSHNLYLGEGDPNAKILIVGKECALNREELGLSCDASTKELENELVRRNLCNWDALISKNIEQENIDKLKSEYSHDINKESTNEYYPLSPHIGQRFMVRRKGLIEKINNKDYPSNKGTAETWCLYQKIVDAALNHQAKSKEDLIDFHQYSFHTELSQIPARSSSDLTRSERQENIERRKKFFHKSEFIQQFPIIVLACGTDYIKGSEIKAIFGAAFQPNGKKLPSPNVPDSQAFWTHYNSDQTKLVIHTRQLSNGVKKELPQDMGKVIADFLKHLGVK